jgi:hypothetical protein
VKISEKTMRALKQLDTKAVTYEMTPERKEKFKRVSNAVVNLLKAELDTPLEGYMVLVFVSQGFEELYGIRGNVIIGKDETRQ